jgi:hypothetical protein
MLLLKPELLQSLDADGGIAASLQHAVELEHATIPPYLYALYSLKPGHNTSIGNLISSVVGEEMAHMALACNILNAIGGAPVIDHPHFIPTYPGALPGAVEHQLTVPLARFSLDIVENVFMVIEEPEHSLDIASDIATSTPQLTIGMFYDAIKKAIVHAGESIFTGDPGRQLVHNYAIAEVIAVTDVASAVQAIEIIVEQGEGTTTTPLDLEDTLAHYYRFNEILLGKTLIPAPGETPPWLFDGDPIPFDSTAVWPIITDPTIERYEHGSRARYACDTFNYTYTSLLKVLHDTFNGQPSLLRTAIGIMESLNEQAQALMSIEISPGVNAGPSFDYQLTNP